MNSVPSVWSGTLKLGVSAFFVLSLAGCGGSDDEAQNGEDAGQPAEADASEPRGTSPEGDPSEGMGLDIGANTSTQGGMHADCAELAACCPHAGELSDTCELSVQVNEGFNCGATLIVLHTMGICVERDETSDSSTDDSEPSDAGLEPSIEDDADIGPVDAGTEPSNSDAEPVEAGTESVEAGSGSDADNSEQCVNLALGAVASAETTYIGYSAANAIDGNRSTLLGEASSWANDWNSPEIAFPQWFDIELPTTHQVARIELYTTDDYRIQDYDYAYRSGSEWVQLGQVTGNTAVRVTHEFPVVETNAIRLVVRRGPEHQFIHARLNEVELYGASSEACN